jgi:hypothetical protein
VTFEEMEQALRQRLQALPRAARAELLHVLMLPDFERATAPRILRWPSFPFGPPLCLRAISPVGQEADWSLGASGARAARRTGDLAEELERIRSGVRGRAESRPPGRPPELAFRPRGRPADTARTSRSANRVRGPSSRY